MRSAESAVNQVIVGTAETVQRFYAAAMRVVVEFLHTFMAMNFDTLNITASTEFCVVQIRRAIVAGQIAAQSAVRALGCVLLPPPLHGAEGISEECAA